MINKILQHTGELLIDQKLSISFAESATAGHISAAFSLVENAGKFLKGGIVCYDVAVKEHLLHVEPQLIKDYTPESMEVTEAITTGLVHAIPADIYVGVTGLTCPGGSEEPDKPVGTIFICGYHKDKCIFSERTLFEGEPEQIVAATVNFCAKLLEKYLLSCSAAKNYA